MTILSPSAAQQLSKSHSIPYSLPKLLTWTFFMVIFSSLILLMTYKVFEKEGASGLVWMMLGVGVFLVAVTVARTLPVWLGLGAPALTISKEGLSFAGQPAIPWANIEENTWYSTGNVVTTAASIRLRVSGKQLKVKALFMKCGGEEYLHYCDLYAAANQR